MANGAGYHRVQCLRVMYQRRPIRAERSDQRRPGPLLTTPSLRGPGCCPHRRPEAQIADRQCACRLDERRRSSPPAIPLLGETQAGFQEMRLKPCLSPGKVDEARVERMRQQHIGKVFVRAGRCGSRDGLRDGERWGAGMASGGRNFGRPGITIRQLLQIASIPSYLD